MNFKYLTGFQLKKFIDQNPDQVRDAATDLLEAIQYYFDVLDEVRGPNWHEKPDHVLKQMQDAYTKATAKC